MKRWGYPIMGGWLPCFGEGEDEEEARRHLHKAKRYWLSQMSSTACGYIPEITVSSDGMLVVAIA